MAKKLPKKFAKELWDLWVRFDEEVSHRYRGAIMEYDVAEVNQAFLEFVKEIKSSGGLSEIPKPKTKKKIHRDIEDDHNPAW